MFGLIVLAIMAVFPIAIAGMVDALYSALPRDYHKAPGKIIWLTVSAFVFEIVAGILVSNAPILAGFIALLGFAMYVVGRAIAFIGLAATYRAYATDNPVTVSRLSGALAYVASFGDALAVFAAIGSAILIGKPSPLLDQRGMSELMMAVAVLMAGGYFVSIFFLLAMNSNKNHVAANERAERKKKTDLALAERQKQKGEVKSKSMPMKK
jgi:hypothetical protein